MSPLGAWQDDFADALRDTGSGFAPAAHPAFAVYRNTVWKGWVDALEANFPAVAALTGQEWMRAAGAAFAAETPPGEPMLAAYGEGFAEFLASFPPAADLPFLPDIARLDRAWSLAHLAPDTPVAGLDALAALAPEAMARFRARLHPSLAAFWFEATIPTLWLANRDDFEGGDLTYAPRGEGLLIARPFAEVDALPVDLGGYLFVDACRNGGSLLGAAEAALGAQPDLDLPQLLIRLFGFGAFAELTPL